MRLPHMNPRRGTALQAATQIPARSHRSTQTPPASPYAGPMPDRPDDDEALEPEEFEEMVAALLKVDPEGITGQRSKAVKAKPKDEKSS